MSHRQFCEIVEQYRTCHDSGIVLGIVPEILYYGAALGVITVYYGLQQFPVVVVLGDSDVFLDILGRYSSLTAFDLNQFVKFSE